MRSRSALQNLVMSIRWEKSAMRALVIDANAISRAACSVDVVQRSESKPSLQWMGTKPFTFQPAHQRQFELGLNRTSLYLKSGFFRCFTTGTLTRSCLMRPSDAKVAIYVVYKRITAIISKPGAHNVLSSYSKKRILRLRRNINWRIRSR